MKKIGILPLRKGSKSISRKNFKKLLGRPLYQWVLGEAIHSELDEVYIFSDEVEIEQFIEHEYKWTSKVKFMSRSQESATDEASTEFGMKELAEHLNYNFDVLCLLQATSPVTSYVDINNALSPIVNGKADSSLTAVRDHGFRWNSRGESLNYDYLNRPRRQDFEGGLLENGAVYAISKEMYKQTENRLGGKVEVIEMESSSRFEIDEPEDWTIVEQIMLKKLQAGKTMGETMDTIILDVDGVFTEGNMLMGKDGELAKSFSFRDGMALELARENGITPVVITSENSEVVHARMKKLNIDYYYPGVKDKYSLLSHLCSNESGRFQRERMAYVGDDLGDFACMMSVNWSFAPANAVEIIKQSADVRLGSPGGNMAIREAVEFILQYNKRAKTRTKK